MICSFGSKMGLLEFDISICSHDFKIAIHVVSGCFVKLIKFKTLEQNQTKNL